MLNSTVRHVAKQSIIYSYMLSQPFAAYVDAYPVFQNELLLEIEQLKYGDHSETVRVLQHKLNQLSYYDDEIDGDFGVLTEHALKKFQSDYNVTISGLADNETINALINVEKEMYIKELADLSETIYPGLQSHDVKIVQRALYYFGYYQGDIDGIYGPLTKKALEDAENEHGLDLTSQITQQSITHLYESNENNLVTKTKENIESEPKAKENNVSEPKTKENLEIEDEDKITIPAKVDSDNTYLVQSARSFIGTPYVWGGQSPGGFDCSGFIQYVFRDHGMIIPRTVSDIWNFSQPVDTRSVGDLVFFETYKAGPSHMGIYIGDGKFIHAGESNGVIVAELNSSYWQQRYLGTKRINIK